MVHHKFVRDGRYSEGGMGVHPHPHQPGLIFSIMMECTPESGRCHSVFSVVNTLILKSTFHFLMYSTNVHGIFDWSKGEEGTHILRPHGK